jgi:hypothetical protein
MGDAALSAHCLYACTKTREGEHAEVVVDGKEVIMTFAAHASDRGQKGLLHDLLHDFRSGHRCWSINAHTAGVRSGVAIADPFVVLSSGERDDGVAVGEGKDGNLGTSKELFDDHLITCKDTTNQ